MPVFRVMNEVLGKKTHGNPVTLPDSSAIELKNWECIRDNVYRKTRGRKSFATGLPSQNVNQFIEYSNQLITHMSNNTLYYQNLTTAFTQISSVDGSTTFTAPDSSNKIQSLETSSNLYFTSSVGIQKLDALGGAVRKAGVPKALGFDVRIIDDVNWLPTAKTVAYRVLFTIQDANTNLIIGSPSERIEVTNEAGADRAVELQIYLPLEITTSYKLEIYRSSRVSSGSVPPEDFQLVYQASPTSSEVSAGVMVVNDILPDDFKGAVLYTNTTQEGIAQSNDRPPLATTLDKYKDYTFYANVETKQTLFTTLVSTQNLTWGTSTITINDGTHSETYGTMRYDNDIGGGITGAANSGTGTIRITTTSNHNLATNDYVRIYGVVGTAEANGCWLVTYVNATNFDLQGSAYVNPWISGGTVDNVTSIGDNVTAMANNGSGKVRCTTSGIHGLATGDFIIAYDATGTNINGIQEVTYVNSTQFDILSVNYVGNGTATINKYEDLGTTPRFFIYTNGTDAQNIENTAKSFVKTLNQSQDNLYWYGYYISSITDAPGKMLLESINFGSTAFYLIVNSTTTGSNFSPAIPTSGTAYVSINNDYQNGLMFSKANQPEHLPATNIYYIGNKGDPILRIVALRDSLFIIKKKDGVYKLTGTSPSNFIITAYDETIQCMQRNSIARGENSIFMFSNLGFVRIGDTGTEIIGRDNEFKDIQVSLSTNFEQDGYGWFYNTEKSYFCANHATISSTSNDIVRVYNTYTQSWHDREYGLYTNDTHIKLGRVVNNYLYTAPITGSTILTERKDYLTTDFRAPDVSITITGIDTATDIITISSSITVPIEAEVVQGAYRKKIIAIIAANQLQLDNTNNLVNGAATIQMPVISTILYQNCNCDEPEIEKTFQEITVFFDNDETSVTNFDIMTYTDLITTPTTTRFVPLTGTGWGIGEWGDIWGDDTSTDRIRRYIPSEEHRGTAFYVKLVHKIPNEQCALCGFSIVYDSITERSKR